MNDDISRQAALKVLNDVARNEDMLSDVYMIQINTLFKAERGIKDLPSTDAVEVVRCKDCKYYLECGCQRVFVYPEPDDYCSRGERK